MTLDDALACDGPRVGAWDHRDPEPHICIYAVSGSGNRLLAIEPVADDQRDALEKRIRSLGIPIGSTESYSRYLWLFGEHNVDVWTETHHLVISRAALDGVLTVRGFWEAPRAGIRVERTGGDATVIIDEINPCPDRDTFEADTEWTFWLGHEIAKWLGVSHFDLNGHESTKGL